MGAATDFKELIALLFAKLMRIKIGGKANTSVIVVLHADDPTRDWAVVWSIKRGVLTNIDAE